MASVRTFLYLYLKRQKQSVNINNICSIFQIILSSVAQGSILGALPFNIFINDLFYFMRHTASTCCDYDSIATSSDSVDDLITELQKESENVIDWFCSNKMVVNPDKIQSIISNRLEKFKNYYKLLIDNHKIDLENSITLSGIETDNKLNFEKHVTALCQKPSHQLNALSCIHKYTGFQEMKILLCSFIFSSFNYCPLVWDFCSAPKAQKIEKIQERALRLFNNDRYPSYNSLLLKAEQPTMEVSCFQD